MLKKICLLTSLLLLPLSVAAPEGATVEGFEHWTPSALADLTKSLATKAATDPHHAATQKLPEFPHEYFLLAHREADGQAEWHGTEADVFVVQSGSATLIVGGTMSKAETTAPQEKRGPSIEGGTRHKLAAGDIVRIPAGIPHQLLVATGDQFNYFVIKIRGY
jgi:mannose-6-phosphate isomerase-like protein (cupin superfamily)